MVHRAGGIDVPLRLKDQDEDGVSGEIIYPTGYLLTTTSPDPGLQLALAQLYNDWYHEIFGNHRDRFAVSASIPMLNIKDAVAEAERVVKMGYRSLSIPITMPALPFVVIILTATLLCTDEIQEHAAMSRGANRLATVGSSFPGYIQGLP